MKATIRFGLGLAGMDAETINEIDAALPAVERLIETFRTNEPVMQKAYADLVLVLPAAKKVIEFMQKE